MKNSAIEKLFYDLGRELLADAMHITRTELLTGQFQANVKQDKTIVTNADFTSEKCLKRTTTKFFSDIPFHGEELGLQGKQKGKYRLLADPLDGTRLFKDEAPGSSILLALYDTENMVVPACHVGCIATGRIWSAGAGESVIRRHLAQPGEVRVQVNQRTLDEQSSVRIDISHGFGTFSNEQIVQLFAGMQRLGRSVFFGSNCLNQALLANGGIDAAVTTGKGGSWDLAAGCCLVPAAGGVTYAYRAEGKKVGQKNLIKLDRLDPLEADVLVMGNTQKTAEAIADIVTHL